MATMRFDPTTSDWVIFAPSRSLRPRAGGCVHAVIDGSASSAPCPFCPGNESLTPREIYSVPASSPGSCGWRVRVVPNKFPALRIEESPARIVEGGHFHFMGGCGAHEVIVESPDHTKPLAQQPIDQIVCVLQALQLRYRDLMRDLRFQTVVIFKNHGIEAGTSLAHPHWQLIATSVVPRQLRLKHFEASAYFDRTGECLYSALAQQEMTAGKRIVARNDHFVAFMPYASHAEFETWILPLCQQASYTHVEPARFPPLAEILQRVLLKLHTGLNGPAFNLTIDDVPRGDDGKCHFLWHMRIIPRLSNPAGFELGSGMSINTVLPEDAVAFLDEVPVATAA